MSIFNHLLSIVFLSSSWVLPTTGTSAPRSEDITLGFAHFETIAVSDTGEGHHKPGVVVQMTSQADKIRSFGLSNEAGVLIEPLPPGRYCYDAFNDAGHHLQMKRPASERCFDVRAGEDAEVGVEFTK